MNLLLLSIIFFIALLAECAAIGLGFQTLQLFSKPSLMLILLVFFWANSRELLTPKYLIISALFFSWLGDIFLLFEKQNPQLFIFGLASFLVAHLFYIVYFYQIGTKNAIIKKIRFLPSLAVLTYVICLYALIAPNLGKLQIPVAIYTLALSIMLLTSIHAFDFYNRNFAKNCVTGTMLFVISDSLLAMNRFYHPFAFAGILIMLTYALAQFLITLGALKNLEYLSKFESEN